MVSLVAQHGVEYLFATVILMRLIQIVVGVMKWGKFIRLVPHPVMLGFVNGLAIVIFLAQLGQFQVPGTAEAAGHGMASGEWLSGLPLAMMLGIAQPLIGKEGVALLHKGARYESELTDAVKNWHMETEIHKSRIDPASVILRLSEIQRRQDEA